MKKYFFLVTLFLISSLTFAYCNGGDPLSASTAVWLVSGFSGNSADITARVWAQGKADFSTVSGTGVAAGTCTGGCDSGNVASVDLACVMDGNHGILLDYDCAGGPLGIPGAPGDYFLYTDWGMNLNGAWDGCTNPTGERACILIYDTSGRYTLESKDKEGSGWVGFDDVGTVFAAPLGANGEVSATLTPVDATHMNVQFTFSNYFLYGAYATGDQPSSPLPTQYQIYFLETTGPGSTPASFATSSWTADTAGPYAIGTTTLNNLAVPAHTNTNNRVWMSIAPIYEGLAFPWVSNQPILIWASNLDPAGAPVIASVSAKASGLNTVVTWKSSDESRVTSYQVYWAPNASAEFAPVGSVVTPTGSNSTYSQSVRIPAQGSFVVKVGANLLDGSVEYSSVASVTPSVVIKDRTRVVPN